MIKIMDAAFITQVSLRHFHSEAATAQTARFVALCLRAGLALHYATHSKEIG
jgi:hypothetical protein